MRIFAARLANVNSETLHLKSFHLFKLICTFSVVLHQMGLTGRRRSQPIQLKSSSEFCSIFEEGEMGVLNLGTSPR